MDWHNDMSQLIFLCSDNALSLPLLPYVIFFTLFACLALYSRLLSLSQDYWLIVLFSMLDQKRAHSQELFIWLKACPNLY